MYQVFVVEDELLIRQNIRSIVEKMPGNFSFCGEASDGEIALSMMQDLAPDILLTDIRMPFLDGFELIRHVKAMMPWIKTVIISGWDDFEYAQKAIELGVDRYLLKPVNAAKLTEELNLLAEQIEAEKERKASQEFPDRDEVRAALIQHFMQNLLQGGMETNDLLEKARSLHLDIVHPFYRVVTFSFETENADIRRLHAAASRVLEQQELPLYAFARHDQLNVLLYDSSEEQLNDRMYQMIHILRHEVGGLCGAVTAITGSVVRRLSGIADSYHGVISLLGKVDPMSSGRVIDAEDTAQLAIEFADRTSPFSEDFFRKLQAAGVQELESVLDEEIKTEKESRFSSVMMRYYALIGLLRYSVHVVSAAAPTAEPRDIAAQFSEKYDFFKAPARFATFRETALKMLEETARAREESSGYTRHSHVITRALAYVDENFCDPNISLISVAEFVNLSPAHFSTMFSQSVGKTFIAHLTGLRIEKAKKLLEGTDLKLAEIAMTVGYNEPNYFSHVFKKLEGVTPKEYRQSASE